MLPKSSTNLLNDSIPSLNGTIFSPFVIGPATNTNSTTVVNENHDWPAIPFNIPIWQTMGGEIRFSKVYRPGTAEQKEILLQLVDLKLHEWADQTGLFIGHHIPLLIRYLSLVLRFNTDHMLLETAYPSTFDITQAGVRFRMRFRGLEHQSPRLKYLWARSALETFKKFQSSREAWELNFQILKYGTALAELSVFWIG